MTLVFLLALCSLVMNFLVMLLFFKLRKNYFFLNQDYVHLVFKVRDACDLLKKQNMLQDLLCSGVCDENIRFIYKYLKELDYDDFPKTQQELMSLIKRISDENYKKTHMSYLEKINKCEDVEEKQFLQKKLEKLQEIKNLYDSIDDDASDDYKKIVLSELNKSILEYND